MLIKLHFKFGLATNANLSTSKRHIVTRLIYFPINNRDEDEAAYKMWVVCEIVLEIGTCTS